MRYVLAGVALLLSLGVAAQQPVTPAVPGAAVVGPVLLPKVSGPIGPATADYMARGLRQATQTRALLVVLQLDTPGGLDTSTRQMVKDLLASGVDAPGGRGHDPKNSERLSGLPACPGPNARAQRGLGRPRRARRREPLGRRGLAPAVD